MTGPRRAFGLLTSALALFAAGPSALTTRARAGTGPTLTVFTGRTHYSNIRQLDELDDEVFAAVLAFVKAIPR